MFHLHAGRYVDKASPAENRAIQRAELVVSSRDDFAKPLSENIGPLLKGVCASHEDDTLIRNRPLDVRINRLAIKLRLYSGKKFALAFWNTEALERLLNLFGYFFPTALGRLTRSQIIANHIKVDFLELISRPMRRQRFAHEDVVGVLTEFAKPFRLSLHINNVIDRVLRESHPRIARWR